MVNRRELYSWVYHFSFRRAGLSFAESDFGGCIQSLREAIMDAERRGDHEMKVCLLIAAMQYALASRHYTVVEESVTQLSRYFPSSSSQQQSSAQPVIRNRLLQLHYPLLFIVYMMHTGNARAAQQKLKEVHAVLDERKEYEESSEARGYTTVRAWTRIVQISYRIGRRAAIISIRAT
ncbi:hypothetical protein BC936DRAFT_146312 [Jimgerdemannia flammicorona]|uniref:Cohesin loading factor-domain-containing protein n=1 Tax=Jimgerdemannia flammicorona TaxID=994334 RepID=A0A433DLK1_9FUNG|nr:hypothetical protein BC936DRAFT_146312 [Jimgerdemannia flammicorona]